MSPSSLPGKLFVISAPSGTGKTTIVRRILQKFPQCIRSISATTRKPRPAERDGIDYHFLSEAEFRRKIAAGEFFEWEEVHGALYGTPKSSIEVARHGDKDLILDIDTRGALSIQKAYGKASCLIFLKPPAQEILEQRLRQRRTEEETSLKKRLEAAQRELAEQNKFDYVIINDDLERAVQEVAAVIEKVRAHDSPR